jgi:adenylate/guanylate cyclase family protein
VPVCPSCGQENPAGFRFSGACATPLAAEETLEERKVITALFADVVGSTATAEQLDPEDVRARLSPYFARARAEVERFGGSVEKFIGDAVVAFFGVPVAHEDDPERAVRAVTRGSTDANRPGNAGCCDRERPYGERCASYSPNSSLRALQISPTVQRAASASRMG